jgi:hypothetical protein
MQAIADYFKLVPNLENYLSVLILSKVEIDVLNYVAFIAFHGSSPFNNNAISSGASHFLFDREHESINSIINASLPLFPNP